MKISKFLPVIGVIAFCVGFNSLQAQDSAAQAAAREALLKLMNPEAAPAPVPQTPPAAPTAPAEPAAPVVEEVAPVVIISETDANAAPVAVPPAAPAPASAPAAVNIPAPVPIVAPALPISMSKESRLQALLAKYKADQITPEQYHAQRAAILSGE